MLRVKLKKAIIKLEGVEVEIDVSKSEMDDLMDMYDYVEKDNEVSIELIFKDNSLWADRKFTIIAPIKFIT